MIKTKKYFASQIAKIVDGELIGKDCEIEFISTDSREEHLNKSCFFPLSGERYNGEEYIEEAILKGASLVISSKKSSQNASLICVSDVKKAFLRLASYNKGNTKIIGITGSNGKTTVKEMVKSVLMKKYKVMATVSNNNNEIGVAQTLLSITDEDFCVLEMGMRGIGEISLLSETAMPDISVITNAGTAHIERLGSVENIFLAKCEILKYTKCYAIVPAEKRFKSLKYDSLIPLFVGDGGNVEKEDLIYTNNGIKFILKDNNLNEKHIALIPSFSMHDCDNFLFAYCVGRLCGISLEKIFQGINEFKNCKNRGNIYKIGNISIIDDCYNASFESVKDALFTLSEYAKLNGKMPYAILGDMLEMGNFSAYYHKKIGKIAKKIGIQDIYLYGQFAEEVSEGFEGGKIFKSKQEIEEYVYKHYKNTDLFLVKASRKACFETIIEGLKERINEI